MDYTNSSVPKILPAGIRPMYMTLNILGCIGNLTVTPNQGSTGNLIVGGFYTPTNQVANNKDNDGGSHPGWLGYYTEQFPKNGFKIPIPLIFTMLLANIVLEDFGRTRKLQIIH